MSNYVYETHVMDPLLPFIFHTDTARGNQFGRPNWHSNIELLCCISGKGETKLNADSCHMEPGDTVVVNSDVIHGTRAEEQVIYYCLIIDNSFLKDNGLDGEQLRFQPLVRDPELAQAMERIARNYDEYRKDRDLGRAMKIRHDVLGILCLLYERYRQPQLPEENFLTTQRVKKVMTYVRQNLASPLSLDLLAAHAGVSKFHLSREFKSTTGITIITCINLYRCGEAKRLIREGMSVSEAATMCGFENMSYFTRTFKKFFGGAPSAFSVK